MSPLVIAFSAGVVVGTILGVIVICLLQVAKEGGRSLE
ncbi:MAG: DUF3789 domain-containing protein [Syntrophales bacterium]|nr:DUF3789 domain-containing protein [Syntrophales bacterium]MDD5640901.1 DUF3789 domain-containing protein [Syntrophales bacterium]